MKAKEGSEGRVSVRTRALKLALSIAFVVFAVFTIGSAEAYTIEDNKVFVDTARVYFTAEPHTITIDDEQIYFELISKQFTGDIDVAFGFDTDIIRPKSAEYLNVDSWNDISNQFNAINYDYGGMDRWYVLNSVNVNQGQLYNLRVNFNALTQGRTKYWVCAKPSSQTIAEAVASDNFLCLDPWVDVQYLQRSCWNVNNPTAIDLVDYTFNIGLDMSEFDTSNGCNDFVFGSETEYYGFWNFTPCDLTGAVNTTWLVKIPLTKADDTTKLCAYYNNTADNVFNSSIYDAGIFADDFEDGDISDYAKNSGAMIHCNTGANLGVLDGYVYETASTNYPCMHKNVTTTELRSFKYYAREYTGNYRGTGWGLFTSYGNTTGYLGSLYRPTDTDIEITRCNDATCSANERLVADEDISKSTNTWYNAEIGRTILGDWLGLYDGTVVDFESVNPIDFTYTNFTMFVLGVRKNVGDSGRIDHYLFTRWCDTCSFSGGQAQNVSGIDITLVEPTNQIYYSSNVNLKVDVQNLGGATVTYVFYYQLNNGTKVFFTPNTTILGLADGNYNLFVLGNNSLGYSDSDSVNFTIEAPPFNETITFVVSGDLPIINITCEGDEKVVRRGRTTGTEDGSFDSFQIDRTLCPYGCYEDLTYLGADCSQPDYLMVGVGFGLIIFIIFMIYSLPKVLSKKKKRR